MSAARSVSTTASTWLAPAGAAIVGVGLLAVALRPAAGRGPLGDGAALALATYDQVLPLIGLGVALVQAMLRPALLVIAVFAGGVLLGASSEVRLVSALFDLPGSVRYLAFIGPLCCVFAAVALAAPGRLQAWILPVLAALLGAAFGLTIALDDPSGGDPRFVGAAAAVGLWLIAAPPAILRRFDGAWLRIGGRIFASWLVAIGLLLGGSRLVIGQRAEVPLTGALSPQWGGPPGSSGPALNDVPPAVGRLREWGDESRQP